jgi:hypothetical protein
LPNQNQQDQQPARLRHAPLHRPADQPAEQIAAEIARPPNELRNDDSWQLVS